MNGTVRESQGYIAPLSATIIHGGATAVESHRDWERWNVDSIGENSEITRETNICAGNHERPIVDLYQRVAVVLDAEDPGCDDHPNDACQRRKYRVGIVGHVPSRSSER